MEKKQVSDEAKRAAAKKAAAARKAAVDAKAAAKDKEKEVAKDAAPTRSAEVDDTPVQEPEKKVPATKADGSKVKGLRIAAIIMWVLALGAEVWAFIELHQLAVMSVLNQEADLASLTQYPQAQLFLLALVLDLVLCIVAAQLWKKSNQIRPSLAKSPVVRTLWHQLGVIMALICLIPLGIVLLIKTKNLNPKVRTILLAAFAAILIGTTAASVDYKQPSKEEVAQLQQEAEAAAAAEGINEVWWTKYGKSYHFDENCRSLARSNPDNISSGSLDDAFTANRWDPCDFCAGGAEAIEDAA